MVKLYSTNCPKCHVLDTKLNQRNIEHEITEDIQPIIDAGFMSAPVLEVDGKMMDFKEAVDWVNNH